jgi:hypothetical protein
MHQNSDAISVTRDNKACVLRFSTTFRAARGQLARTGALVEIRCALARKGAALGRADRLIERRHHRCMR